MFSPTLLCIDDRRESLQLRKDSLERLGYSVATATSASAAIAILEEIPVAAVLLEYKLEGIETEATALHIKQRFPNQPIILLSGRSEMRESILWLVDEYVMKSEPLERLVQAIESLTTSACRFEGLLGQQQPEEPERRKDAA
jgi:CheY-like chemotaxis protein